MNIKREALFMYNLIRRSKIKHQKEMDNMVSDFKAARIAEFYDNENRKGHRVMR